MYVYNPDIPRFSGFYINLPKVLELNRSPFHLPGENAAQFSAVVAIHTVPIFVPPGTHYRWVGRGGVDLKFAQGFYTWTTMRESNPRALDLGSNALTARPCAPHPVYADNYFHISTNNCLYSELGKLIADILILS